MRKTVQLNLLDDAPRRRAVVQEQLKEKLDASLKAVGLQRKEGESVAAATARRLDACRDEDREGISLAGITRRNSSMPLALQIDVEAFIGYTDWQTGRPPCSGYWEITNGLSDIAVRRWFNADKGLWYSSSNAYSALFPFTESLKWRGIKAPHPEGYTYRVRGLRVKIKE